MHHALFPGRGPAGVVGREIGLPLSPEQHFVRRHAVRGSEIAASHPRQVVSDGGKEVIETPADYHVVITHDGHVDEELRVTDTCRRTRRLEAEKETRQRKA